MRKLFFFLLIVFSSILHAGAKDKILVFDFGGVIAKTNKQMIGNFLHMLFNMDADKLLEALKVSSHKGISEREFFLQKAMQYHLQLPCDFMVQFEVIADFALQPMDGMQELLASYRQQGYQMALLSNVTCWRAQFLRKRGWYDGFFPVLLSCEIGASKPDQNAYRILLECLSVPPEQCIFIDDKTENVDAAKSMGIDAILFVSADQLRRELEYRL